MKAYRDLSKELGHTNLQVLKFPEVKNYEPGGMEASHVGKMKTRPKHHCRHYGTSSGANSATNTHTDYTSAKKLREASSDGTFEQVLELLRNGANAKKQDSKGRTALHFASCRGASDIVQVLIRYGASVNERDCNGSTPLHLACCTNHTSVVTTLLKAGTDVNALDGRGVSPLHLAYSRLRLARRSDDAGGEALSRKREMSGIVEMLREYLTLTDSGREETDELDELASKLSLSDTPQQVDEVQDLLEGFTSLSIKKRHQQPDTTSNTSNASNTTNTSNTTRLDT